MSRRSFSPRDKLRRRAPEAAPPVPVRVTDHAVLQYLVRALDIPLEVIRAEIGRTCARHQGAPVVKADGLRYLIREGVVVTVLTENMPLTWPGLADLARSNLERVEA